MMIHIDERPDQCNICDKAFSQYIVLKHMTTHTLEKDISVPYVTSNFFSKGDLTAHFRLHTGEKVYNGGQCDKTFPFYSSFIVHAKTHSE